MSVTLVSNNILILAILTVLYYVFPGNNPLMRSLFEVDTLDAVTNLDDIQELPALWRFRAHVSLEHLSHELDENTTAIADKEIQFTVLQLFLKQVLTQAHEINYVN